jgi:ABC-2 type transport system ATP-binding protein
MQTILATDLVKKFTTGKSETIAVNKISLQVDEGELFGVIGPDGAGKTTLFRILISLLLPDSGSAVVDGSDVVSDFRTLRKKIGYMPGRFSLYPDLTVEENLTFFATIFNTSISENYHLIKDIYVQIEPFRKRKAGKLSGGMKQKLALCCALIHKPVVLVLDEPTTGVDAVSRVEFWEMLRALKSQNITILVSTPYMDEASRCDKIALMQEGQFLTSGSPSEIISSFDAPLLAVRSNKMSRLAGDLNEAPGVKNSYAFGEYAHAVMDDVYNNDFLQQFLAAKGHRDLTIRTIQPDIEDCFLKLMQ